MYFPKANSVETNPFCMYGYVLLGMYFQNKLLEVELLDQKVYAYTKFHFHSKIMNQCIIPPVCESASVYTDSPIECCCSIFIFTNLVGEKWYLGVFPNLCHFIRIEIDCFLNFRATENQPQARFSLQAPDCWPLLVVHCFSFFFRYCNFV